MSGSKVSLARSARTVSGHQVCYGSCFIVDVSIIMPEVGGCAICPRAGVLILVSFSLKLHHTLLLVEKALSPSMGVGERVVPAIGKIVDLFVLAWTWVVVGCVREGIRNWKKRTDLLGLKRAAPVPLCLDTLYRPLGDKASGSS
jgi:hypothetical protein